MLFRAFALVLLLLASPARAQTLTANDIAQAQRALQVLDYPVTLADGIWREETSWAVAHYLSDFGIADRTDLSRSELAELLARAAQAQSQTELTLVPTATWSPVYASTAPEQPMLQPPNWLFASGRHALAIEMLARTLPYDVNRSQNPTYKDWANAERLRAEGWLRAEVDRLDRLDPTTVLFQKTLIDLDLILMIANPQREDILREVLPRLRLIVERFPDSAIPDALKQPVNDRLLSDLTRAVYSGDCSTDGAFPSADVSLILQILQRAEALTPGTPALMGTAREATACTDPATADRLFTWRRDTALALQQTDLAFDIGLAHVRHMSQLEETDRARAAFARILDSSSEAQRIRLAHETPIFDLATPEIAHRYTMAYLDSLRGADISSRVGMQQAFNDAVHLLEVGYPFDIVDRLFTTTRNGFCTPQDCDLLAIYVLIMNMLANVGDYDIALPMLDRLIDRARAEGNSKALEDFSATQIEILLSLGRFSETEARIGDFIGFAKAGAADPRIANWQAQLNLVSDEAQSVGLVFARNLSAYLDVICVKPDPQPVSPPQADREAVLDDPAFLPEARRLDLANRLATCKASPYRMQDLLRTSCYLWAKDNDLTRLTKALQDWLLSGPQTRDPGSALIVDPAAMACPMGIADAQRSDLIAEFAAQLDDTSTNERIVLLKLASRPDPAYAEWVRSWTKDDGVKAHNFDYLHLEAATRLKDPVAAQLRDAAAGALFLYHSGAAADSSELAAIRAMALDLAAGYAALNLDGIALYFLETAAPEVETAPDPSQVGLILSNAETARYMLARARLALRDGDPSTALAYVGPLVETYLRQVEDGTAGSVEDLGPWARRLRGFVELYLSALAADPTLLAATPPDRILAAQQLLSAADSAATTGRLAARLAATDPDLARRYQDALRDWRGAMMAATSGKAPTATIAEARARLEAVEQALQQIDPAFAASSGLLIIPANTVQAKSGAGAVVVLTTLPDTLLVSTVQADRIDIRALPVGRDRIGAAVAGMRNAILAEGDLLTPETVLLAQSVLSGFGPDAPMPAKLTFVVDGPLVALPFGALPLRIGTRQSYLGAEVALAISPSLALLSTGTAAGGTVPDRPFLGIGDASYTDSAALTHLGFVPAPLRETNAELRFMAAVLEADIGQDLLLGPAATEAKVMDLSATGELARFRTVVFATHGFFDNPGKVQEAGLLLSEATDGTGDGILGVSEIYGLRLNADLVILSACDTGAVTTGTRGLSDLARAFTYAGARNLIVTHWEIDTHAATELSRRLAVTLKVSPGSDTSVMLQSVVRDMLQDPAAARYHHPRHWASHMVVGL
ncbi:MAG: CHAT domain-containing protein [Tabrizicola sp.]|jgi:hypothetical protein|nr:CHAT domain-containing protein [Tabrizicola sp.]